MKYVITEDKDNTPPFSIRIFPAYEQHSEVAEKMKGTVVGAGFCWLSPNMPHWICYGMSASLDVESRKEDEELLNRLIPLI
jgi:hypothetical protein